MNKLSAKNIIFVLLAFFVYATSSIFTKAASLQEFLSWQYVVYVILAIIILGGYALLWQQIISKIRLVDAYMFRGTVVIWELFFFYVFFKEMITWQNIIGVSIIIIGITLYVKVDRQKDNV